MKTKKILYIKPEITTITGGVKVNEQIFGAIEKIKNIEITVKDLEYFWKNQPDIINKLPSLVGILMFNLKFLAHTNEFKLFDYIFVDSRFYIRLFILINMLKKNRNIKIVTMHHHFFCLEQQNPIKKFIYGIVEINSLKNADKILTFSKYTFNTAKDIGIDEDKLSLDELGFEKNISNDILKDRTNKELLFIGSVEPRKGLEYLIRAIAHIKERHPDIVIHIVGNNNLKPKYFKKLVGLIRKFNLDRNILFHGILSDEEITDLKNKVSFFVFPSLYEGFGMVMAECMLYGLPVVAFDNSAMPYLVKDNINGLIAINKDTVDLSKKIEMLLENRELRERLSIGAVETAKNLNSTTDFSSGIRKTIHDYMFNEED